MRPLSETEAKWLGATSRMYFDSAREIVERAGIGKSAKFAGFAKRNYLLFQRQYSATKLFYRLSTKGHELAETLAKEARAI
jgi:hypothetical protein